MEIKKIYIIAGIVTLLIGSLIVYPIESKYGISIEELIYTFSILIAGILTTLYGLFSSTFLKILLFLSFCILMSMLFLYLLEDGEWGSEIVVFWLGLPSGAISGILFLIVNRFFIKSKFKSKMYIKQGCILIVIYAVVTSIMAWGSDVLFYIKQYFS